MNQANSKASVHRSTTKISRRKTDTAQTKRPRNIRTARVKEMLGRPGDEGIAESLYYSWSKEFLEAGKNRLAGDTARQATAPEVTAPGLPRDIPGLPVLVKERAVFHAGRRQGLRDIVIVRHDQVGEGVKIFKGLSCSMFPQTQGSHSPGMILSG